MEDGLVPVLGNGFGDDDGDDAFVVHGEELIDVFEDGFVERSVGGIENNEGHFGSELDPRLFKFFG